MKGEGHTFNFQSCYMSFELNNNLFFVKKKIRNTAKRESEKKKNKNKNKKGQKV